MEPRETLSLKMDHPNLDREPIAESYVLGRLREEERIAFEAHFVDCPRCLEALETSRSQAEGWKGLTAEELADAFPPSETRPQAPRLRFPAGIRRQAPLLLAAALVVSLLATAFFYLEWRQTDRELASAEQTGRATRERSAGRDRATAGRAAADGRSAAGDILAATPGLAMVVTLDITRGAEPEAGTPIAVDGQTGWVVLLFAPPDVAPGARLRADLAAFGGRPAVGPVPVALGSSDMLAAAFPSSAFKPGDYVLKIESTSDDRWEVVARYRLRAVSSRPDAPAR
jgi:hypothetical protein